MKIRSAALDQSKIGICSTSKGLLTRHLQEALIRTDLQAKLQIDYDILLSPTYRVPVLYFTLRWHNCQGPVGLDAVYQYVVPAQWRDQLRSVGVMGAISFAVGAFAGLDSRFPSSSCPRSIIPTPAPRPFMCIRATLQMLWHRLQMHRASVPGRISSSGSVSQVTV